MLVLTNRVSVAQVVGTKFVPKPQKTVALSCWDENGKDYRSRSVRGLVLVARDSLHRTFVEVSADATGKDPDGFENCHNRAALFVSTDGESFRKVFQYDGEEGAEGSGIQLIDWSADSKQMVADLVLWKYFSEGWAHNLLIYSEKPEAVKKVILNDLFSRIAQGPCSADVELLGFGPDGRIAVKYNAPDEVSEDTPCVDKESMWTIGLPTLALEQVKKPMPIETNGKFEVQ